MRLGTFMHWRIGVLVGLFLAATVPCSMGGPKDAEMSRETTGVTLAIAAANSSCPTRLALVLRNSGTLPFRVSAVEERQRLLTLKMPGGRTIEHVLTLDRQDAASIPAGGSGTWWVRFPQILRSHNISESGIFEVKWSLKAVESAPLRVYVDTVSLSVALVPGSDPTELVFTLRNVSDKPFRTTPICTNQNRVVVVPADGKEFELFEFVRLKKGGGTIVEPFGKKVWRVAISQWLRAMGKEQTAPYRVFWRIGEHESPSVWFHPPKKE